MNYLDIIKLIEDTESSEENAEKLTVAVDFYCSVYDKCYSLRTALIESIKEQYEHFPEDQKPEDLEQIKKIIS